jgi:TRAP-type C4-dicarboxylate transport system permease small subunit
MTTQAENLIIALALAAMVLIPLAESALRSLFSIGIPAQLRLSSI